MAISPSESRRLRDDPAAWRTWGPYLSERAWGTVREDYSEHGEAWDWFPHDHARSRVYRWNEDGLGGICDDQQRLCFAFAFWNGRDPILKERIFGLTGPEGNHGEDAKEYWWYLDSTPSHSWMRWRYLYPQAEFPYADLVAGEPAPGVGDPEYELLDTGIFDGDRYWEITADYAKAAPDDLCIRVTVRNAGPDEQTIELLPTLWFRFSRARLWNQRDRAWWRRRQCSQRAAWPGGLARLGPACRPAWQWRFVTSRCTRFHRAHEQTEPEGRRCANERSADSHPRAVRG